MIKKLEKKSLFFISLMVIISASIFSYFTSKNDSNLKILSKDLIEKAYADTPSTDPPLTCTHGDNSGDSNG